MKAVAAVGEDLQAGAAAAGAKGALGAQVLVAQGEGSVRGHLAEDGPEEDAAPFAGRPDDVPLLAVVIDRAGGEVPPLLSTVSK